MNFPALYISQSSELGGGKPQGNENGLLQFFQNSRTVKCVPNQDVNSKEQKVRPRSGLCSVFKGSDLERPSGFYGLLASKNFMEGTNLVSVLLLTICN